MNDSDDAIWVGDLLNRKAEADFLIEFLIARVGERRTAQLPGSYVLNLNAAWGEGKTFFLERLAKTLSGLSHVVASVNAWSDDHADDPLLPVMAAIETAVDSDGTLKGSTKTLVKSLGRVGGQVAAAAAKGAVKQAAKRFLGEEAADLIRFINDSAGLSGKEIVSEVAKELDKIWSDETKALLNRFKNDKKSILQFREFLHRFVSQLEAQGRGSLFVLIDELDRCRPPYAIALLERVKHLFDVSNIIFVVATDTEQLQHSVAAVYGNTFDSTRYLGRFFNRTYQLEKPSRAQFVSELVRQSAIDRSKISLPQNYGIEKCFIGGMDYCGLSLRDAEQAFDILRSVITLWKSSALIEMVVLMPLVLLQQQKVSLTTNSNVPNLLKGLCDKNGGDLHAWDVDFSGNDKTSVTALYSDFIGHAKNPLSGLNYGVSSQHSRWVVGRLSDEFQKIHDNHYNPVSPPFSRISNYLAFVRSAGRLSPFITK